MNKFKQKIRIAIQNNGRLMNPSLDYLKKCGLKFNLDDRKLIIQCKNQDVEIIFVRNCDIPEYVRFGVADYGILGQNLLLEKNMTFEVVKKLDFGKCNLVLAVDKNSSVKCLEDLDHERIATSYPRTLKAVLKSRKVSAAVIEIQGCVEICPRISLSDAVFDISQSGKTLEENGLRIVEKIANSQAVIIKNPGTNNIYEKIFI